MEFCEIDNIEHAKEKFKNRLNNRIEETFPDDSKREIALRAGISPSYFNTLRNGGSIPSIDKVFMLSYELDVLPMYFIEGLERYIKVEDIVVELDSIESQHKYVQKVNALYDIYYKSKQNEQEDKPKIKLIPVENLLQIEDNSMSSFNIIENSALLYTRDYNGFVNGQIYVIEVEGTTMVRRVWKTGDGKRYILIPCSNKLYDIIEKPCDDESVVFLGIPVNVTIPIA